MAGQAASDATGGGHSVQGVVLDSAHLPLGGATVRLSDAATEAPTEATTDVTGHFQFVRLAAGQYRLVAVKAGQRSDPQRVDLPSAGAADLTLVVGLGASGGPAQAMQFADQPEFSVAGVTDWTAVGGHGSDSTLRTAESLASATVALGPSGDPASTDAVSHAAREADALRTSGERSEEAGDAFAAVRDFEGATKLDPSERSYFAWGSELLLHRAIWQAEEVFQRGVAAFPGSARMQTGLGTALFAGARYDEAAERLCAAAALDPGDPGPYLFLGRMQVAAPKPLACVEPALARFVAEQPGNATALYLYAMATLKRSDQAADGASLAKATTLLQQAAALDPQSGDANLELGILAARRHNMAASVDYYRKAIAAAPELAEAHYRLGVAYDRSGRTEEARREFKLHDELERKQAQSVERQRREVKQFLFAPEQGRAQE